MANRTWYFPCNPRYYKIFECVANYDYIYWHMGSLKYQVGDTLYMYISEGYSRIMYKYVVTDIFLDALRPGDIDTDEYNLEPSMDEEWEHTTMRIQFVAEAKDNELTLDFLRGLGHRGFMSPNTLSSKEIEAIEKHF